MDSWGPPDADFPRLTNDVYQKTSEPDSSYNCVAWALGRTDVWFGPEPYGYAWPLESHDSSLGNFIEMFKSFGFSECDDGKLELGREKVVIFAVGGEFTHAARQLSNGKWTSKLGEEMDIEHEPNALEGPLYGKAVKFMQRALNVS